MAPERRQGQSRETAASAARLVIASQVRLVREGLALCLRGRAGILVIDEVDFSERSLRRIADERPDIVLIDLSIPDGLHSTHAIRQACPSAKLVAFAIAEMKEDVFACAAAGFCGYVSRDGGAEEVLRAVLDAVHGRLSCAPHITAAMFERLAQLMRRHGPAAELDLLTGREKEILVLAEAGCSNKEIARELSISGATVKNHMHSILQKLQVKRRSQAAALLRQQPGRLAATADGR